MQTQPETQSLAMDYFAKKLQLETDCSDVYAAIKHKRVDFILLDVRSAEAYAKSHAISALNLPHADISAETLSQYPENSTFVVYCWGPGCNGATKAAYKIARLGFKVKEMLGGIHYWEDFERYPVNRLNTAVQA